MLRIYEPEYKECLALPYIQRKGSPKYSLSLSYQAGIPTQSSSQATMVGPFQSAKGVPAFIASSSSSCLQNNIINNQLQTQ